MTFSSGQTVPLGNIKGKDGVGIAEVYIQDGNLFVRKTNEDVAVNLGNIKGEKGDQGEPGEKGEKGDDGRGIVKTEIIDGHLWITYSDDLENPVDLGKVTNPEYEGTEGLEFYLLPDGTYGVKAGLTHYMEDIVIPETYNGVLVTQILPNAFKDACNLKTIIIPETITNIAEYAFYGCSSLETAIEIPDTMTFIPQYAFYNCTKLSGITLPNTITEIGTYAFYKCSSLPQITIPAITSRINPYAFYGCTSATVTFEDTTHLWRPSCVANPCDSYGNQANYEKYLALFYSFSDTDYATRCIAKITRVYCYCETNSSSYPYAKTAEAPSTVTLTKTTYTNPPSNYTKSVWKYN